MDTIALKKELIDKIAEIDDIEFLRVIKDLLDNDQAEPFIVLTPELKKRLILASEEAKKGNFISQEEMDEQVKMWLREG